MSPGRGRRTRSLASAAVAVARTKAVPVASASSAGSSTATDADAAWEGRWSADPADGASTWTAARDHAGPGDGPEPDVDPCCFASCVVRRPLTAVLGLLVLLGASFAAYSLLVA